jgi:hypothetical protein
MVSINDLPLVVLGVLVLAGMGFLLWALYRMTWEAHANSRTRRSR